MHFGALRVNNDSRKYACLIRYEDYWFFEENYFVLSMNAFGLVPRSPCHMCVSGDTLEDCKISIMCRDRILLELFNFLISCPTFKKRQVPTKVWVISCKDPHQQTHQTKQPYNTDAFKEVKI